VNSENKSIVWTAGHCVHDGSGGQFVRNWIFVPAYSSSFNGQEPFGRWTAKELWTTTEWANNGNFRQDLGAVVLNRLNNQLIVDRIGGQGIAFNLARNQNFSSFGYPAASPFNGFDQFRCNSPRLADDFPAGVGPATIKIDCNMTGGSSGGGWLINIASNGLGYVNGLNSYRYSTTPNNLFGPYFGNEALSLYNAVRNRLA
jgi:V8-like Glu-specific endopeptidase